MDITKSPYQVQKTDTPRFVVPSADMARMERRRNSRLRNLMDQLDRANANQNTDQVADKPSINTLNRNGMLARADLLVLQSVNDEELPAADRRNGARKSAAEASDDLPLFNPLKKDISI